MTPNPKHYHRQQMSLPMHILLAAVFAVYAFIVGMIWGDLAWAIPAAIICFVGSLFSTLVLRQKVRL